MMMIDHTTRVYSDDKWMTQSTCVPFLRRSIALRAFCVQCPLNDYVLRLWARMCVCLRFRWCKQNEVWINETNWRYVYRRHVSFLTEVNINDRNDNNINNGMAQKWRYETRKSERQRAEIRIDFEVYPITIYINPIQLWSPVFSRHRHHRFTVRRIRKKHRWTGKGWQTLSIRDAHWNRHWYSPIFFRHLLHILFGHLNFIDCKRQQVQAIRTFIHIRFVVAVEDEIICFIWDDWSIESERMAICNSFSCVETTQILVDIEFVRFEIDLLVATRMRRFWNQWHATDKIHRNSSQHTHTSPRDPTIEFHVISIRLQKYIFSRSFRPFTAMWWLMTDVDLRCKTNSIFVRSRKKKKKKKFDSIVNTEWECVCTRSIK